MSADCISCGREWGDGRGWVGANAGVIRCPPCAELGPEGFMAGACPSRGCREKLRGVTVLGESWFQCDGCDGSFTPETIRRLRIGEALDGVR